MDKETVHIFMCDGCGRAYDTLYKERKLLLCPKCLKAWKDIVKEHLRRTAAHLYGKKG